MNRKVSWVGVALVLLAAAIMLGTTRPTVAAGGESDVDCTIIGTERNDRLVGTPGDDVICGLGGNDTLIGNGGNDVLIGGPGNDKLLGGRGRDAMLGDAGNDILVGGAHSDQFIGGAGRDRLTAGTAGDTCDPNGDDRVSGQCQTDVDAPVISDVKFPSQINAGGTMKVTWRVTDSSGLYDLGLETGAAGPTTWMYLGGKNGWVLWCGFPVLSTRVSGDAFDGRYEVSCSIPDDAVNGTYSFELNAVDLFGNYYSDLRVPYYFTVGGGSSDGDAPAVTDLTWSSSLKPGADIKFRWRATDETGVKYVIPWVFGPNGFLVDLNTGELWVTYDTPTLVSGNAKDGWYEVTVKLNEAAPNGTYKIWVSQADVLGNKDYSPTSADGTPYGTFTVEP